MAKSKRKKNRSSAAAETPSVAEVMEGANRKLSTTEQFQQEYAYVIRDLRTVFILAAVMFALLIILNIVLQ